MEAGGFFALLKEFLFLIVVFSIIMLYAMGKGRQSVINLIFGLYLALLISLNLPFEIADSPAATIGIFLVLTVLSTMLVRRRMPNDYDESAFQNFWRKLILALMATVLVMIFSYNVLPVTEIITPGSPIQTLFGEADYYFWWLMLPLVALFFL